MNPVEPTQSPNTLQSRWDTPLNAREWDKRFPGIMDGVGVLAGAANVVLQLAHSPVGHGVRESRVESGSIIHHPIKRARTTFTYLSVAMLGTSEEKLAYRKAVNRSHAQVKSTENSPVKYNAFDPELQLWVAACLYWGYVDAYTKLHGTPSQDALREFYRLAEPLGTTLQVRPGMWPADLDAFNAYWDRGLENLHIDAQVRAFLMQVVDLEFLSPLISVPLGPFHRFVTTGFLPQKVRDAMHLPWSEAKEQNFKRFLKLVEWGNGLLPRVIRQMPFNIMMWDFRRRLRGNLPLV